MARESNYRTTCPDDVYVAQGSALDEDCEIFIVRELGPLGFVLQETIDGQPKHFNVSLGSDHSCTCPAFRKKRDLCKHICWLLLKRYRLDRNNPLCWQRGLVDREINELLYAARRRGQQQQQQEQRAQANNSMPNATNGEQPQRPIDPSDICPVCQETFGSKLLPVTYCRFGCGNNVHTRCMKIWADHQHKQNAQNTFPSDRTQSEAEIVRCPMCRGNFSTFARLKLEYTNTAMDSSSAVAGRRAAAAASNNGTTSTTGAAGAQSTPGTNIHPTLRQLLERQRGDRFTGSLVVHQLHQSPPNFPPALSTNPQLTLPAPAPNPTTTTAHSISSALPVPLTQRVLTKLLGTLPLSKLVSERSKLLAPGQQCLLCFHAYALGELVFRLPRCRHQFHRACLERRVLECGQARKKAPKGPTEGEDSHDEEEDADANSPVPLCPIDHSPIFEFASASATSSSSFTHPASPNHHSRPLAPLIFQNGSANVSFDVGLAISGIKCAPSSAPVTTSMPTASAPVLQHQTSSRGGAQPPRVMQLQRGRPPLPGRRVQPPSTALLGSQGEPLAVVLGLSGVTAATISTSNYVQRPHEEHTGLLFSSELEAAADGSSVPDAASLVARGPRGSYVPSASRTGHGRERAAISAAREAISAAREARGGARFAAANSLSDQRQRVGSARSSSATRTPIGDAGATGREGAGTRAARATPQRISSGNGSPPNSGTGGVTSAAQSTSSRPMMSRTGSVLALASTASTHAVSEEHVQRLTLASESPSSPQT